MAIISALEARLRCEKNTKHAADAQSQSIEKLIEAELNKDAPQYLVAIGEELYPTVKRDLVRLGYVIHYDKELGTSITWIAPTIT